MSKISNKFLEQMPAHTIKGNNSGSTANPSNLTATQVTAELNNFVGDSGSGGTKGLVPAPASGDALKFLNGGGGWSTVSDIITAWTSYTPTFTNTGTESNVYFSWRQVGSDSIDITGTVDLGVTGDTNPVQISLPSGLAIAFIFSNQRPCGISISSSPSSTIFHASGIGGDTFFMIFDQNNSDNLSGANAGGNTWTFHITSLPVTGL